MATTTIETLTGTLARPARFRNRHWQRDVPAGTEVTVTVAGLESDSDLVYVRLAGTRSYAAILPKSIVVPA